MFQKVHRLILALVALSAITRIGSPAAVRGDDKPPQPVMACQTAVTDFDEEVWAKVGVQKCLTCHQKGGEAEESNFVLLDPRKTEVAARDAAMRHNRTAFARMAAVKENAESRMLLKVQGKLDHGGSVVLTSDSAAYRVLADFVRRVQGGTGKTHVSAVDSNAPPFFDGVVMLDDRRLLRRVTLSLAGRLPSDAEFAAIASEGLAAFPAILDALMKEIEKL